MDLLDTRWWQQNGMTVFFICVALVNWIALQALMIHYHFFRKNLQKPRPDSIRMALMEKTIALQTEQLEKIFGKLAFFNREIDSLHIRQSKSGATRAERESLGATSIESSVATLGELALKKRIQEIETAANRAQ